MPLEQFILNLSCYSNLGVLFLLLYYHCLTRAFKKINKISMISHHKVVNCSELLTYIGYGVHNSTTQNASPTAVAEAFWVVLLLTACYCRRWIFWTYTCIWGYKNIYAWWNIYVNIYCLIVITCSWLTVESLHVVWWKVCAPNIKRIKVRGKPKETGIKSFLRKYLLWFFS